MGTDDAQVIAVQIGRRLRAPADVVRRCPMALPVVTRVPPLLEGGEPFPTRYWLTCPLACRRVARLEAEGGVREADRRLLSEPELAAAVESRHLSYAAERDAALPRDPAPERRPTGGVGGARRGVKCLHAHLADHLAGNANPIGAAVDARVGELDCHEPCVIAAGAGAARNRAWREPPAPALLDASEGRRPC